MNETFTLPNDPDIAVPEVKPVVDRFDAEPRPARYQKWRELPLRKVGAVVATAIAVGTGLAGTASASNSQTKSPTPEAEQILGTNGEQNSQSLRNLEDFPGYSMRIRPEARKRQLASTVKILDGNGRYQCTGTLVSSGKKVMIATAAHCFGREITQATDGFTNRQEYVEPIRSATSGNILATPGAPNYYISAPVPHEKGMLRPDGEVKAISVSLDGDVDLALTEFNAYGWGSADDKSGRTPLMELPAMPLEEFIITSELPGQETAQVGIPQTTDGKPVTTIGRFLGIIHSPWNLLNEIPNHLTASNRAKQLFAITAIHVPSSIDPKSEPDRKRDACYFGASGSGAKLASGKILLGLARRLEKSVANIRSWEIAEKALGVKIPEKYNVLCWYSVPSAETIKKLVDGLKIPLNFDHAINSEDNREYHRQLSTRKNLEQKYFEEYSSRSIATYDQSGQPTENSPNQEIEDMISKINLQGNTNFRTKAQWALRILAMKAPEQFNMIISSTATIGQYHQDNNNNTIFIVGKDGMDNLVNTQKATDSPITVASKFVEGAYRNIEKDRLREKHGNDINKITDSEWNGIFEAAKAQSAEALSAMGAYRSPEIDG